MRKMPLKEMERNSLYDSCFVLIFLSLWSAHPAEPDYIKPEFARKLRMGRCVEKGEPGFFQPARAPHPETKITSQMYDAEKLFLAAVLVPDCCPPLGREWRFCRAR